MAAAIAGLDEGLEAAGPLPALTRAAIELELRANHADAALARVEIEILRSRQPVWWMVRKAELLAATGRGDEAQPVYAEARQQLIAQPAHRRNQPGWRELEARLQIALSRPSRPDAE